MTKTTKITGTTVGPQVTPAPAPKTLTDAVRYFSDEDRCIAYLAQKRWPDGEVKCPICGSGGVTYLKNQRRWKCGANHERRQFSVKVGTVFEDSPLSLTKWLPAVWMIANCKNGISSLEIHRAIGVTQKTAWFMLHRIRFAMHRGTFEKMGGGGPVEADETFIGGKARNMYRAQRDKMRSKENLGKALVMGLLDRETGKVQHNPGRRKATIHAAIREHVKPGAQLFTDDLTSCNDLVEYERQFVNHAETYVDGLVHTNSLGNVWSLLKRGLKGTYVSVEPFHLFRYLDEQAFRYNERKRENGDAGRVEDVIDGVVGKRFTYEQLTGGASASTAATA